MGRSTHLSGSPPNQEQAARPLTIWAIQTLPQRLRLEQSPHSPVRFFAGRLLVLQSTRHIQLDRILILRSEPDELHCDASFVLFPHNSRQQNQRCPQLSDRELQPYFLSNLDIQRRLKQHPALADVHATQGKLPVVPCAFHLGKQRHPCRSLFEFPVLRLHCP